MHTSGHSACLQNHNIGKNNTTENQCKNKKPVKLFTSFYFFFFPQWCPSSFTYYTMHTQTHIQTIAVCWENKKNYTSLLCFQCFLCVLLQWRNIEMDIDIGKWITCICNYLKLCTTTKDISYHESEMVISQFCSFFLFLLTTGIECWRSNFKMVSSFVFIATMKLYKSIKLVERRERKKHSKVWWGYAIMNMENDFICLVGIWLYWLVSSAGYFRVCFWCYWRFSC